MVHIIPSVLFAQITFAQKAIAYQTQIRDSLIAGYLAGLGVDPSEDNVLDFDKGTITVPDLEIAEIAE